jgi:drug/metabolite transporter (DMT)-like permease
MEKTRTGRDRMLGALMANIAIFAWSINVVLGRWLHPSIGPLTLSAVRYLIASVFFAYLWKGLKGEERRLGRDTWLFVIMALSGVVAFSPALYLGLRYTAAINATLILSLSPFVTGFLGAVLIGTPMTRRQAAGGVISLAGVVILISGGSLAFWTRLQGNAGDLIVLGAVFLWGLYSVLAQKVMDHRSTLSTSTLSILLGLPLLVFAGGWELQTHPVSLNVQILLAMLFIGTVPTVIAYLSWNDGIRRLGASGAMVLYNMMPVYGALLGFFFLGERLSEAHFLGGSFIVGGGLLASTGPQRTRVKKLGTNR